MGEKTGVDSLAQVDARVGGQDGDHLPAPHVYGRDRGRPAPPQAFGEAAGRGADIQSGAARYFSAGPADDLTVASHRPGVNPCLRLGSAAPQPTRHQRFTRPHQS